MLRNYDSEFDLCICIVYRFFVSIKLGVHYDICFKFLINLADFFICSLLHVIYFLTLIESEKKHLIDKGVTFKKDGLIH